MLQQIRQAMGNKDMEKAFSVFVEADETYIGGKPRKENVRLDTNGNVIPSDKPKSKCGRGTNKTPVVGVKERSSKCVYAQIALPNEEGKKLSVNNCWRFLTKFEKMKRQYQPMSLNRITYSTENTIITLFMSK
jgi:hypothetical protein